MNYLYATTADLKNTFHCGSSTVSSCRRFIAENPGRYTPYGVIGNLTNMLAFADAYKYRTYDVTLLPPFEPEQAAMMIRGVRDDG